MGVLAGCLWAIFRQMGIKEGARLIETEDIFNFRKTGDVR